VNAVVVAVFVIVAVFVVCAFAPTVLRFVVLTITIVILFIVVMKGYEIGPAINLTGKEVGKIGNPQPLPFSTGGFVAIKMFDLGHLEIHLEGRGTVSRYDYDGRAEGRSG